MKGLLRMGWYGARGGAIILLVSFAALGIVAAVLKSSVLLIAYVVICVAAFAINGLTCMRRELGAGWDRYAISTPIRRRDIVRGKYAMHALWMAVGLAMSALIVGASAVIHQGLVFDNGVRDLVAVVGVCLGVPLLIGAVYYPTCYVVGADRSELVMVAGLVAAVGVTVGIIYLINWFQDFKPVGLARFALGIGAYLAFAIAAYVGSYFGAIKLYGRNEF